MDEFGLLRSELSKIIGIALQAYANKHALLKRKRNGAWLDIWGRGRGIWTAQHTAHRTQHAAQSIQHAAQSTQHTAHSTQHTAYSTHDRTS